MSLIQGGALKALKKNTLSTCFISLMRLFVGHVFLRSNDGEFLYSLIEAA